MLRRHIDVYARNGQARIGLSVLLVPELESLLTSWIGPVPMEEKVGHKEVVTGTEVHVPQNDETIRFQLRLVDSGQHPQCEIVSLAVPVFEVARLDVLQNGQLL